MTQTYTDNEVLFRRWHQTKMTKARAMEELQRQQLSAEEMASIWDSYYRYRVDKRNTLGWLMMGIGGTLGLVSCVLTMLDPVPAFRGLFMYGFTSTAVMIALYGCYLVMEKSGDEE
jgi:hypothetical protein